MNRCQLHLENTVFSSSTVTWNNFKFSSTFEAKFAQLFFFICSNSNNDEVKEHNFIRMWFYFRLSNSFCKWWPVDGQPLNIEIKILRLIACMISWFLLTFTFPKAIRLIVLLVFFHSVFTDGTNRSCGQRPPTCVCVDTLSIDVPIACMKAMKILWMILRFSNHPDLRCAFGLSFRIIRYVDKSWK